MPLRENRISSDGKKMKNEKFTWENEISSERREDNLPKEEGETRGSERSKTWTMSQTENLQKRGVS